MPTTYTYGLGVPNELSKLQTPGQYTRKYAYDNTGDTTAITTTGSYSASLQYDSQARLVGVSFKSGQVVTMTYNAQGQRASYSMTQPGQPAWSAQFQYRGALLGQAVIISGSQTYTDTYLYDQAGSPLELLRQQNGATNRYWYVLDGRGNVVALTDVNGNVVNKYAYDAWGAPTTISETVPQRWRYAGYWYDQELGWYWVSVRSYDPVLKRWLQPDPSQQDGVRTFVYVGDDPIDETDPTGLVALTKPVPATPAPTPNPTPRVTPTPGPGSSNTSASYTGPQRPLIVVAYATGATTPHAYYLTGGDTIEIPLYQIRVGVTMYDLPVAVIGRPATGAYAEGVPGGIGLGKLAGQQIRVTDRGLNIVRNHLKRFGDDPANEAMVRRLQTALDNDERVSGADASFYLHEISEATMMDQGIEYEIAHAGALAKYEVSPYSVYDPEVIRAYWNESGFNQNWLDFWEIEGEQ